MNNNKNFFHPSYYNIIVLSLILVVLFSVVRLKSNKETLALIDSGIYENVSIKVNKDEKMDSNFFINTLQHMFPNRRINKEYKPFFSFKDILNSFLKSIFIVDFHDPLTFVQAQFPVAKIYDEILMADMPRDNKKQKIEEDWSREIHFVEYNNEEEAITANKDAEQYFDSPKNKALDEDDLGEIKEGIYIVGDDNIIDSLNSVEYKDLSSIPKPKTITIDKDKPSILIYHTHGTESYKPATEGNYHSLKKEYTVITVGDIIKNELEKKGYNVIHDTTYHDYPSYNGSYSRSLVTARGILEKHSSIKVVLDIHRDGYDNIDARPDRLKLIENSRIKINNEYVARFQFVIGATTENRKEVESFAQFVKAVSDVKYPGFSKEVLVKQYGRYNQFLSDKAALIELGSNANTIEEAKNAGYYLADILGEALKLLEE